MVVPTCISLIEQTTEEKSSKRFEQLCALLGEGIIGTVWLHGMRDAEVVQASVEVLPALFSALGIGCARYLKVKPSVHPIPRISSLITPRHFFCISTLLISPPSFSHFHFSLNHKALIPQLVHTLIPAPENSATISMQIASARALCVVIAECAPRMHNWKGTILDGVCRCWVTLVESRAASSGE